MQVLKMFLCVMALSHQSLWCVADGQQDLLEPQVMKIRRNSYEAMTEVRSTFGARLQSLAKKVLKKNVEICARVEFFFVHTQTLTKCLHSHDERALMASLSTVQTGLYEQSKSVTEKQNGLGLVYPEEKKGNDFISVCLVAIRQQRGWMLKLGQGLKKALDWMQDISDRCRFVVLPVSLFAFKQDIASLEAQKEKIMILQKEIHLLEEECKTLWIERV